MSEFVTSTVEQGGYLGVLLLMLLETVFPPIPSEVIMPLAGLQSTRGEMHIAGVIVAGTAGAMLGNLFWFYLARAIGIDRFEPLVRRWGRWITMHPRDIQRSKVWFDQHGRAFVLFGRLLPTVRSLVSIPAGLAGMKLRPFVIYSTIGTAGWTAALALAGHQMGQNYEALQDYIGPASMAIVTVLVIGYVVRVIRWNPN